MRLLLNFSVRVNTKIIAASTDEAFVSSDKQSSAEEIDSG